MSSHDIRYDDPAATGVTTQDGPVLLPTDVPDDRPPADRDDAGPITDTSTDTDAYTDAGTDTDTDTDTNTNTGTDDGRDDDPLADPLSDPMTGPESRYDRDDDDQAADAVPDPAATPAVGPDTETGALKDPVPDASPDTTGTGADESVAAPIVTDEEWHDLQGRFVDDPQAAVHDAGQKVEAALAELRSRIEKGSTEDLRTAFRRYRDLFSALG